MSDTGRRWFGQGGSGWYAGPPEEAAGRSTRSGPELPPEGATLRFMGDHGATVPLWYQGLLFAEPEDLTQDWGVSPRLANEMADWAAAWDRGKRGKQFDDWARRLINRLDEELRYRYTIDYRP